MIKRSLWVVLLASGLQSSWAYSLGGPIGNGDDSWQVPAIGYGLASDLNAPKKLGEGFRRNTPVIYWGYDGYFDAYFRSNGVAALQSAFAVLNDLTNVDDYSPELSGFPLETRHINYQAQTLGLFDLKSFVLGAMMEQMGLADPVRYAWTLHTRLHVGSVACPVGMEYLVVQRNYDFTSDPLNQLQSSPYVNNVLYNYQISEICSGGNPLAVTVPFSVDPLADTYSPVASFDIGWGDYYTGLTRDDVAGLRDLLSTNNINYEEPVPGALLMSTNLGLTVQLTTSNLWSLLTFAQTNDPALIPTVFPNVTVAGTVTNYVYVTNWDVGSYLTNPPGYPAGTQLLVTYSNIVGTAWQPVYDDTFANVITNGNLAYFNATLSTNSPGLVLLGTNLVLNYSPNTKAVIQTVQIEPEPGYPAGTLYTNTTTQNVTFTNQPSGEYLTLPPSQCGWRILDNPPSWQVVAITNLITQATNTFVGSESIVYYFTNHTYLAQPITCPVSTPSPWWYEGVGKVRFVEANVPIDPLTGQFTTPITNYYTMTIWTNSQAVVQKFERVLTTPDILFSGADLVSGPGALTVFSFSRNLNFDTSQVPAGHAGPGTITPSTTITFDTGGPVYYNSTATTMDGTPYFTESPGGDISGDGYYSPYFVWASFNGTTNAPVVYPNGTSVGQLQNQVFIQVSPTTVPGGFTDVPYGPVTFTATGGSFMQPYTWSASGLPAGLTLTSNSDSTATLSGAPQQSGTFDFVLTLTDNVGQSVHWNYTITIQ